MVLAGKEVVLEKWDAVRRFFTRIMDEREKVEGCGWMHSTTSEDLLDHFTSSGIDPSNHVFIGCVIDL